MIESFPSITPTEFAEACQTFEQRCHDKLHGTSWLSVQWNADDDELLIHQNGNSTNTAVDSADPTEQIDTDTSLKRMPDQEDVMLDQDSGDEDMEVVERPIATSHDRPAVTFSIILSPTYRVPVLWFWLPSSSSTSIRSTDLVDIYARLVSGQTHDALKSVGVMGGISIANHPVSDKPGFFVHPCNTPEALQSVADPDVELCPFTYLVLWIGLVGAAVGLHVPRQIVA